jgi:hypothetical protein
MPSRFGKWSNANESQCEQTTTPANKNQPTILNKCDACRTFYALCGAGSDIMASDQVPSSQPEHTISGAPIRTSQQTDIRTYEQSTLPSTQLALRNRYPLSIPLTPRERLEASKNRHDVKSDSEQRTPGPADVLNASDVNPFASLPVDLPPAILAQILDKSSYLLRTGRSLLTLRLFCSTSNPASSSHQQICPGCYREHCRRTNDAFDYAEQSLVLQHGCGCYALHSHCQG